MHKKTIITSLAGAAVALSTAIEVPSLHRVSRPLVNQIAMEPVLMYSRAGTSALGSIEEQLVVYSSGLMVVSKNHDLTYLGGIDIDAQSTHLSELELHAIERLILQAGSFGLTDSEYDTLDMPLSTVTVFKGGTNSLAHTFSYFDLTHDYYLSDKMVKDLIDSHFPGFQIVPE